MSENAELPDLTVRQAEELLTEYATIMADRDTRVRLAFHAGLSKSRIWRLTGISRPKIDQILAEAAEAVPDLAADLRDSLSRREAGQ